MDQASNLRKMMRSNAASMRRRTIQNQSQPHSGKSAPRVISITSGKGGVGKTNIVGNLAIAFTRLGKRVLILDADLGLANIDIIFGINPEFNIGHVLDGEKELKDIILQVPGGVRIIPAGSGFVNLTHLSEGQKLNLLSEFDALDGELDILLIDTGAGISSNVLYFNLAAEECILIATTEPTSITDAFAMMKVMSTQHNYKFFKLLVNMVNSEKDAKQVYSNISNAATKYLDGVGVEYIGYIPVDTALHRAVLKRQPAMIYSPDSQFCKQINTIADHIIKQPIRQETDGNIKFFLKRFMNFKMDRAN